MDRVTRSRFVLFGLLTSPWGIGLSIFVACSSVGYRFDTDQGRNVVTYGLIPWLSTHHPILNLANPTYHVDPLGLMALVATLLVLAVLAWATVHVIVSNADMRDRCHTCGYRIVGSAESCPECGVPYPDPAVLKRRIGLGRIHRPLVIGVLLILTIPGVLWAFTLVIRLRTFSLVNPFGSAVRNGTADLERTLAMAAWALIALSTLVGAFMLWRFRSDKSDGVPTPLLNELASVSPLVFWRMMGFILVIWLNVVPALAMILWLNDVFHYVFVLSSAAFPLFLCFSIASFYNDLARRRARRRAVA